MLIPKGALAVAEVCDAATERYCLDCVQINVHEGKGRAAATDGRCIAVATWSIAPGVEPGPTGLVPKTSIGAIGTTGSVVFTTLEGIVELAVRWSEGPLSCRTPTPQLPFPSVGKYIEERPKEDEVRVWVDARCLATLLELLPQIACSDKHSVCLRILRESPEDKPIHLATRTIEGQRGFAVLMPLESDVEETAEDSP